MIQPPKSLSEKEIKRYLKRYVFKLRVKRLSGVVFRGWLNAGRLAKWNPSKLFAIWVDMIKLCYKSFISRKIYASKEMYNMTQQQRKNLCWSCYSFHTSKERALHWNWNREYVNDRKFQIKYTTKWWNKSVSRRKRRVKAYQQRYNMGKDCVVQYDVDLNREHYLEGSIKTGDHVLFSKHVFIDYSGEVVIDDNAKLANGVIIETHYRDMEAYDKGKDVNIPTKLHICERAYIGSRAMILSSCHYIGKHARVGAGAVVTKDVPDYATVVGVPAKVIKVNAPTIPTETN